MSEENVITEKPVNLSELEPIKGGSGVDLDKYHKKEVKIETTTIEQVKSDYSETGKQWVLKVVSEILETYEKEDGIKVDFKASELFNLIQDKEGKLIGYPESPDSNLQKFMADIKAKKPDEIKEKKATIKAYKKEKDGQTQTYLKFLY